MRKGKLNLNTIKELDKSDMLSLLLDFPNQIKNAADIGGSANILCEKRNFNKIVFAGLGGSAIGADLVKAYLYFEIKIPIIVCREYELPAYVDESTLVFICSYSGNTEETLSAYEQAREKKATMIAISSDGKVKEYAQQQKITFIGIPQGLPPRCALGYLSIVPLCLLAKIGLINDPRPAINQAVSLLEEKRKSLDPHAGLKDNTAKFIASKIFNKFVVVYSASVHFDVTAIRLRGQLAENSKALSSSHVFPEMNHNEIVGWSSPKKLFKDFAVLLLRDEKMHPRVAKRMNITKDIIKQEGATLIEIWSSGEDLLGRILSIIYTGDFISYYLAILYGIDPTPVERVTYLKNKLAQS